MKITDARDPPVKVRFDLSFYSRLDKSEAPLHTGISPTGKGEKDGYSVVGQYQYLSTHHFDPDGLLSHHAGECFDPFSKGRVTRLPAPGGRRTGGWKPSRRHGKRSDSIETVISISTEFRRGHPPRESPRKQGYCESHPPVSSLYSFWPDSVLQSILVSLPLRPSVF